MIDLDKTAREINEILEKKRQEYKLSFEEDGHIYTMLDINGKLRTDWLSVSSVEKAFYDEFDSEQKALEMSRGDTEKQKMLLESWKKSGLYATNKGSRVHFELERYALNQFKINKEVREPIFECDEQQMFDSDKMIISGKKFLDLMKKRGCVLIDTEVVLGSPKLNYVGQGDDFWISHTKDKNNVGIIITDHKTNQVKNLVPQSYNGHLKTPFGKYRDYAVTHYYIQLSLYAKLMLEMLKGSKYENISILGCILDSLRDDKTFEEYRVPKEFTNKILEIELSAKIKNLKKCQIISKTD
jgi:hypothetical protein